MTKKHGGGFCIIHDWGKGIQKKGEGDRGKNVTNTSKELPIPEND